MEPVSDIGTIASKKIRKPLQILQPTATNKETLVGTDRIFNSIQPKRKIKKNMTKMTKKNTPKITTENKAIQTTHKEKIKIEANDLTSDNPSENYWQVLAERRRKVLVDTLEENKNLHQRIVKLEEENRIYKEMLDETRTLIEVLQEEINDRNDVNNF
ncbi:geminin-like [Cataglyphis hispanica]|uniref:geminin-like n=1 Tax=Cataglyphis hispanica TaxID=1086592 RepID=UPI002180814D|nr:geminin-like [Cataglyphis hispanica]